MDTSLYTTITVTNEIATGAAFGIKHGTGESCFIPASIMFTTKLRPGDTAEAVLIPNPNELVAHRTPHMVRFVKPRTDTQTPPAPQPVKMVPVFNPAEVEKFVRDHMKAGGVWTVSSLFEDYLKDPEAVREDHPQAYNAVSNTLRKMFDNDECAKWSMWTKASQSKPGREWFSCYPNKADVAEWED